MRSPEAASGSWQTYEHNHHFMQTRSPPSGSWTQGVSPPHTSWAQAVPLPSSLARAVSPMQEGMMMQDGMMMQEEMMMQGSWMQQPMSGGHVSHVSPMLMASVAPRSPMSGGMVMQNFSRQIGVQEQEVVERVPVTTWQEVKRVVQVPVMVQQQVPVIVQTVLRAPPLLRREHMEVVHMHAHAHAQRGILAKKFYYYATRIRSLYRAYIQRNVTLSFP